ncbi:MAG: hypothetical protein HKN36_02640, partial [Hellea sp.]|nr:hypothetical protein [Hellea sp.]
MKSIGLIGFGILLSACQTLSSEPPSAFDDTRLDQITWDGLEKFSGDNEFKTYMREARKLSEKRDGWWASNGYTLLAQAECENPEDCMDDEIVVTGASRSASSASPVSITNVQTQGVDEGDIVKQIGDHLVVLQDGRLFSVDMGNTSGSMEFIDRFNVYNDENSDTWYDEILTYKNRILVTGYSYDEEGTELSVVDLNSEGKFEKVATFYISSDDYYDPENYATRIVNGKLVIYTPLYLTEYYDWEELEWPVIRRWVDEEAWDDRIDAAYDADQDQQAEALEAKLDRMISGKNLFDARNIYKPVQRTAAPVVHSVSVCSLDAPSDEEPLDCRNTAFIGPERQEMYVSGNDVFMWIGPGWDDIMDPEDSCEAGQMADIKTSIPSAFYRIPIDGVHPEAVFVKGEPINQFSFETFGDEFRAVLKLTSTECEQDWDSGADLTVMNFPMSKFSRTPSELSTKYQTLIPNIG